jgi:hypothetical protein
MTGRRRSRWRYRSDAVFVTIKPVGIIADDVDLTGVSASVATPAFAVVVDRVGIQHAPS